MTSGTLDPLLVRARFKRKPLFDALIPAIAFLIAVVIASVVIRSTGGGWKSAIVVDVLLFALALVYHVTLVSRSLAFACPHCENIIGVKTPWQCGFCREPNHNVEAHPMVHACEHCNYEPKAYKCHHKVCGDLIFFTVDKQEANFAQAIETAPEPSIDAEAEIDRKRGATIKEKEFKILVAELDAKLRAAKERKKSSDSQSQELLEEDFKKFDSQVFGAAQIAARARAETERDPKLKKNPELKQKRLDAIDAWEIGKMQ